MKLYTYCITEKGAIERLESIEGVARALPRVIHLEQASAVVSDFEGETVAIERPNVFAHERVLGRVLQSTTPLPFRFGTIVSESQLCEYVGLNRERLLAMLRRVRGCVEMSVKIIWEQERAGAPGEGKTDEAIASGGTPSGGPGRAFLDRKRLELGGEQALKERAEAVRAWLERSLGDTVREAVVTLCPTRGLTLSAAHIVERERLADYRSRLELAQAERRELRFLTSGAWPPYSITALDS